jgi:hypothetical protein
VVFTTPSGLGGANTTGPSQIRLIQREAKKTYQLNELDRFSRPLVSVAANLLPSEVVNRCHDHRAAFGVA